MRDDPAMTAGNGGCHRMAGKVAMVTGAGAEGSDEIGIGRAIALLLAREGAKIASIDKEADRAEATARQIRDEGGEAISIAADVTDADACVAAAIATADAFGGIDVLVNNVGIAGALSLCDMDIADWRRTIDVNLTGAMLMCRAAVPHMIARGGGSVVNISSVSGILASGALAYGPSKAALHQFSRELAVQHGRDGIRANTVAPGHMATPMAMRLLPPDMREKRRKVGPLGTEGDAWDVARAVLFLASDESRFINGVHLPVDGGVTSIGPLTGAAFLDM